jgi:hypothetical protein
MVGVPGAVLTDSTRLAAMVDAWERVTATGPRRARAEVTAWSDVLAGMAAAQDRVVAAGAWTAGLP